MEDCIFCKIVAGEMPAHKVYEDDDVMAFLDIRPVNPGHTLIIPKAHAENLLHSSEETMDKVLSVVKKVAPGILKAVGTDAFNFTSNVGRAAGQIVFHTHFHIMPRFSTDGYKAWERENEVHEDFEAMAAKIRKEIS